MSEPNRTTTLTSEFKERAAAFVDGAISRTGIVDHIPEGDDATLEAIAHVEAKYLGALTGGALSGEKAERARDLCSIIAEVNSIRKLYDATPKEQHGKIGFNNETLSRWKLIEDEKFRRWKPTTDLLLQIVVVPGRKTDEGQLIEAVALPWFEIIELLRDDPTIAFKIPDRKWEEIIAGAYKKAGFDEVTLTPRSGDYGRDVIAVKKGLGVVRVIDQVKAFKPGHLVTADDVRALLGVLHGDGASKGFLTTTSDFAPKLGKDPLIRPFIPSRLELINGHALLERLSDIADKKSN